MSMGGMLILALGLIFLSRVSKTQLIRQFREKEHQKEQYQHQLLEAAIDTQERERARIAAELHDHIGSNLQALKLFLHQLNMGDRERIERESTRLLEHTIQDVKNLSHELMPASLTDLGLQDSLYTFCSRLHSSGKVRCTYTCEGKDRLEPSTELALYRMVQELTSNTLQHARADSISIRLSIDKPSFSLIYKDNGIGLPKDLPEHSQGLGLKNIESRCQLIGAQWQYPKDELNQGFKIILSRKTEAHDTYKL